MISNTQLSVYEAFSQFLMNVRDDQQESQADLGGFIRWCGRDRLVNSLTPVEVEEYSQQLAQTGDAARRLRRIKSFLSYLKREGVLSQNLATHVKARRSQGSALSQKTNIDNGQIELTSEGLAQMKAQLEDLKLERVRVSEDIRKAAADKDFRENAPLEAAREHQGHVESRIRELEALLLRARAVDQKPVKAAEAIRRGSTVTLKDLTTGQSLSYILVDPTEADPGRGKLSVASPVGRALLNRRAGEQVEVATPRGTLCYLLIEAK